MGGRKACIEENRETGSGVQKEFYPPPFHLQNHPGLPNSDGSLRYWSQGIESRDPSILLDHLGDWPWTHWLLGTVGLPVVPTISLTGSRWLPFVASAVLLKVSWLDTLVAVSRCTSGVPDFTGLQCSH